jgi:hypothetical protein
VGDHLSSIATETGVPPVNGNGGAYGIEDTSYSVVSPVSKNVADISRHGSSHVSSPLPPASTLGQPGPWENTDRDKNKKRNPSKFLVYKFVIALKNIIAGGN